MWKQKYYKLYFNDNNDLMDNVNASLLKYENFPKSLFKYMKAEYAITSLGDDYIKVSTPFDANDPFEGELFFDYDLLSKEYMDDLLIKQLDDTIFNLTKNDKELIINDQNPLNKLIEILYENKFFISEGLSFNEFKKIFTKGYNDYGHFTVKNFNKVLKKQIIFVSLSESNNITPLWAHYADDSKGVCIEYDLSSSEDFFLDEPCHPICYVEQANYTEEINQLQNDNRNKLKLLEEPFLKKSIDWSYEKEWRVLINKTQLKATMDLLKKPDIIQRRNGMCFIKFPKPTSVFLGLNISENYEIKIKEICRKRDILVYKMVKDENGYNLSYIQI